MSVSLHINNWQFETLFRDVSDGIILTDLDGVVLDLNPSAKNIFGDIKHQTLCEKIELAPSDGGLECGCKSLSLDQALPDITHRCVVKKDDHGGVPIEMNLNRVNFQGEDRLFVTVKDFSHQRKIEELLARAETKLNVLYASSHTACMTFDLRDMRIVDCNKSTEVMFNTTKEEFIGLHPADFSPEFQDDGTPSADAARMQIEETVRKGRHKFSWTHKRLTGESFPCEIHTCVQDFEGLRYFVANIRDMTEENLAKKELRDAKHRAEDANRLKSRFLANMSHEIRTPLNGIIGLTDVILRCSNPQDVSKYLSIIKACGEDLNVLIDDILTLSKIEANSIELDPVAVNIRHLIRLIKDMWESKAKERNNNLLFSLCESVPDYLMLDPVRTRQCISNLLSNAIKFTENGNIDVKLQYLTKSGADFLCVTVKDTGIGMTKAEQETVFEAFAQADASITRKYGGTGLGLNIVKSLVEKMGGNIMVRSVPGQGSTFALAVKTKTIDSLAGSPLAETSYSMSLEGVEILYAEDNDVNAQVLELILKDTGAKLTRATNGIEAVDFASLKLFDLILMDIDMPKMNGLEATEKIKTEVSMNRNTPIIATTASIMGEEIGLYHKSGMVDVCAKPLNTKSLVNTIQAALTKKALVA